MNELLYELPGGLIVAVLAVAMAGALEVGTRLGLRAYPTAGSAFRTHVGGTAASLLGILALLLGFAFSLAMQRFEARSTMVVGEANALGTAYLRAELLPAAHRAEARGLLREYVGVRVEAGTAAPDDGARQDRLAAETARLQAALWERARQAAQEVPNPVTTGLFVQAVNEAIDAYGKRDAEAKRHVPEPVLMLLFATFLLTGAVVGYSAGVAGHRTSLAAGFMALLIVATVFVVLDLDRPLRGFIQVSQQPMLDLGAAVKADAGSN